MNLNSIVNAIVRPGNPPVFSETVYAKSLISRGMSIAGYEVKIGGAVQIKRVPRRDRAPAYVVIDGATVAPLAIEAPCTEGRSRSRGQGQTGKRATGTSRVRWSTSEVAELRRLVRARQQAVDAGEKYGWARVAAELVQVTGTPRSVAAVTQRAYRLN